MDPQNVKRTCSICKQWRLKFAHACARFNQDFRSSLKDVTDTRLIRSRNPKTSSRRDTEHISARYCSNNPFIWSLDTARYEAKVDKILLVYGNSIGCRLHPILLMALFRLEYPQEANFKNYPWIAVALQNEKRTCTIYNRRS